MTVEFWEPWGLEGSQRSGAGRLLPEAESRAGFPRNPVKLRPGLYRMLALRPPSSDHSFQGRTVCRALRWHL